MKPELRRRLLKELVFVLVIGTPALLFFLAASPRVNAAKLLRRLQTIQVNRTHFNDAQQLASQFGGYAACVGDNCVFQFQNIWMHRLHLAPLTEFTVMLQRSGNPGDPGGGQVGAVDLAMLVRGNDAGRGVGDSPLASALVFDRSYGDAGRAYRATITIGSNGQSDRTVVVLSPQASPHQRQHARAFDLACLTRFGGCRSSRDLLPEVWSGAEQIQSVAAPVLAPKGQSRFTASATVVAMH